MLLQEKPGVTDAGVTPRAVYQNRSNFLRNIGLVAAASLAGREFWELASPSPHVFAGTKLAGVSKSPFSTTEKQNTYDDVTHYNNYYEFGVDKTEPAKNAQSLKTYPWTVSIEGEVKKPRQIAIDASKPGRSWCPGSVIRSAPSPNWSSRPSRQSMWRSSPSMTATKCPRRSMPGSIFRTWKACASMRP